MARGENADLSGLELPDPDELNTLFFGIKGDPVQEKNSFAKCVTTTKPDNENDRPSVQWFIRMNRGEIIDPHGVDSGYNPKRLATFKFKKVSKKSFDNYITYLKSRNRLYFTKARRLAMEY
tara:strand:+ start:2373 stop:2735 length:363 start_codon:yes stop_codon:yes gene_type:complete